MKGYLQHNSTHQLCEADDFRSADEKILGMLEIDNASSPPTGATKRPLSCTLTKYRSDKLDLMLEIGALEPMGIPGIVYSLAYTKKNLDMYKAVANSRFMGIVKNLKKTGGYASLGGTDDLYSTSPTTRFTTNVHASAADELSNARKTFFTSQPSTDSFENSHFVEYDSHKIL